MSFCRFGGKSICGQAKAAPRHFISPTHKKATYHISPHDTTLPLPTQPHPAYSSPHPPLASSTQQSHHPHSLKKKLFNRVPQKFLSEKLPHGLTAAWHFGVWIPNLGALPIIASVSLTHNPSLVACLHESMSCLHVFFSTDLSTCVLRAACLVSWNIIISPFSSSKHTNIWMSLYTYYCFYDSICFIKKFKQKSIHMCKY